MHDRQKSDGLDSEDNELVEVTWLDDSWIEQTEMPDGTRRVTRRTFRDKGVKIGGRTAVLIVFGLVVLVAAVLAPEAAGSIATVLKGLLGTSP